MKLLNVVITCERDRHLEPWHAEKVDALGFPMERLWCEGQQGLAGPNRLIVEALDIWENLPLKTYGAFRYALKRPGWTHLLKSDVNSYPIRFNAALVEKSDLAGFIGYRQASNDGHYGRVAQKILREAYRGKLPPVWCGGPAYCVSRRLVQAVVERGVWFARAMPYEDVMVSLVAHENGMIPVPGLGYFSDGRQQFNEQSP